MGLVVWRLKRGGVASCSHCWTSQQWHTIEQPCDIARASPIVTKRWPSTKRRNCGSSGGIDRNGAWGVAVGPKLAVDWNEPYGRHSLMRGVRGAGATEAGATSPRWNCPKCRAVNSAAEPVKAVENAWKPVIEEAPPNPGVVAVSDSPAALLRALFAGFQGSVPRRGPGWAYRLALLLTALAIVVLLVAFLATVVAGGFGLYWYATTILPTAFHLRGRAMAFLLAVHVTVVLAWGGLLLSTLLPVFHRRRSGAPGRLVPPSEATVLYSFVARIAEALGHPLRAKFASHSMRMRAPVTSAGCGDYSGGTSC